MNIRIEGMLENLGKTATGGFGAEIRGPGGFLTVIPGLSKEQMHELAPFLFERVCVSISEPEQKA